MGQRHSISNLQLLNQHQVAVEFDGDQVALLEAEALYKCSKAGELPLLFEKLQPVEAKPEMSNTLEALSNAVYLILTASHRSEDMLQYIEMGTELLDRLREEVQSGESYRLH